jgi:hypothetical protein
VEVQRLNTKTTLLQVSLLLEEEALEEGKKRGMLQPETRKATLNQEEEIRKAVLAAISTLFQNRKNQTRVNWSSSCSIPLDGKAHFGQCVVCKRWVFDSESPPQVGSSGVSRGAKVNGQFRCDAHLPHGHPLCFAGRGYDGPVPGE